MEIASTSTVDEIGVEKVSLLKLLRDSVIGGIILSIFLFAAIAGIGLWLDSELNWVELLNLILRHFGFLCFVAFAFVAVREVWRLHKAKK